MTIFNFNTIGLIGKYISPQCDDVDMHPDVAYPLSEVLSVLADYAPEQLLVDCDTLSEDTRYTRADLHKVAQTDVVITIGGDGTFLSAARSVVPLDTPIIGINMGRLGFLTDTSPDDIASVLPKLLSGEHIEQARTILQADVIRENKTVFTGLAVNDVVIHKAAVSRMIELDAYVDGQFLSVYRADGLIVSTSTGSTAYSLSGGGPILVPGIDAFIVVPICPHTLTQRPLVISAESEQRIHVSERNQTDLQITLDGQQEVALNQGDEIVIRRHPNRLRVLHPTDYNFVTRIRQKLSWGTES